MEIKRNANALVIVSAEKNDLIALELVVLKKISEEYLTMFNADGSTRKTGKSKLLQSFSRQPVLEVPSAYISLVDMGLIWRLASPTSDDHDGKTHSGTDYLWRDYLNKVYSMIYYSRHNNATTIILINNNYTVVASMKDDEHKK